MQQEQLIGEQGIDALRELLAPAWEIAPLDVGTPQPPNLPASLVSDARHDLVYTIRSPHTGRSAQLLVEVKATVSPGRLRDQVAPYLELMRQLTGDAAVLVIAPWLSPRSRQYLDDLGYGYLDLTGNIHLRLPGIGIVIKTEGATQSPVPTRAPWRQQLRGDKAGVLARLLVDVVPGYSATDLANATGLSAPYISRLLAALEEQALVHRTGRRIDRVDWQGLLRTRSESYDLLKANPPLAFTPQRGIDGTLELLRDAFQHQPDVGLLAVTGSVAAREVAPLTVGDTQLMIHVGQYDDESVHALQRRLRLLVSPSTGGQVLLMRSSNPVVFQQRRIVEGLPHVALSQLVLDSLGGPGRMPAEAEALLEVMAGDERAWRLPDIASWGPLPG